MRLQRPSRRLTAAGLWLLLTSVSTAVHLITWGDRLPAGGEWLIKGLDNMFHAAAAPFWLIAWYGSGFSSGPVAALVVNGAAWASWLILIFAAIALRSRLHRSGRAAVAEAPPTNDEGAPADPFRRRFLVDAAFLSGSLIVCGTGTSASVLTPWSLVVRRYSVPIRGLPASLDGLRLVQVTDTHLGPRIPAEFITEAVDLALSLKPDLIVLTGDYVHNGTRYIDRAAALFDPLVRADGNCMGVVGVLGNHDHYADAGAVTRAMQARGVRMIDNDRVFIDAQSRSLRALAPRGPALCIAGLDDLNTATVRPDLALGGVDEDVPRIVLAHTPDTAEIPALRSGRGTGLHRADLMLSGHTHGGQVRFPVLGAPVTLSRYGQKYVHGLVEGPACPVVISAGVGMSVFPVRFGVPPEVVEITLTRA